MVDWVSGDGNVDVRAFKEAECYASRGLLVGDVNYDGICYIM